MIRTRGEGAEKAAGVEESGREVGEEGGDEAGGEEGEEKRMKGGGARKEMRDRIWGRRGVWADAWVGKMANCCLLLHAVLLIANGAKFKPGELAQVRLPAAASRRTPAENVGGRSAARSRSGARAGVRRALMCACARLNAFACGCVCACSCTCAAPAA